MIALDAGRGFVDASADSIIDIHESVNQPQVQPAGRSAQAARAAVALVRRDGGVEVLVALTLTQTGENVIYAADALVDEADAFSALDEGLNFAESMGFMLDPTGWSGLDPEHRSQLLERLPAFRAGATPALLKPAERAKATDPLAAVARLFAAFALLCAALASAACGGPTAEQRTKGAEIHYDLGTNLMNAGNAQGALFEYLAAVHDNPDFPQVHNALGLLYGFSFDKPVEAEAQFQKALELEKDFSEAHNNYGAFLLARGRFAESVPQFQKALENPLYAGRAIAESNLGWALYKTGAADKGLARIRAALMVAPKYCKGWRQLGTIYADESKLDQAAEAFGRYALECPEIADAYLQEGKVLARQSRADEAKAAFVRCAQLGKLKDPDSASECQRFLTEMGSP